MKNEFQVHLAIPEAAILTMYYKKILLYVFQNATCKNRPYLSLPSLINSNTSLFSQNLP